MDAKKKLAKKLSFHLVPETCSTVESVLADLKEEVLQIAVINGCDLPLLDAAVSAAFIRIRDNATIPLRKMSYLLADQLAATDQERLFDDRNKQRFSC